jgi:hypothetical protein
MPAKKGRQGMRSVVHTAAAHEEPERTETGSDAQMVDNTSNLCAFTELNIILYDGFTCFGYDGADGVVCPLKAVRQTLVGNLSGHASKHNSKTMTRL